MSSNKKSNITSWHGRRDPITEERPTTYTVGSRSDSPVYTSKDDARKAKRELELDPYRSSPLPDVFKTSTGETPIMKEIMPELEKRNEGWGEKRSKPSELLDETKKGGRNTKKTKTKKRRKPTKSAKSAKSKKSKKSKKSRKKRKMRKMRKTVKRRYGGRMPVNNQSTHGDDESMYNVNNNDEPEEVPNTMANSNEWNIIRTVIFNEAINADPLGSVGLDVEVVSSEDYMEQRMQEYLYEGATQQEQLSQDDNVVGVDILFNYFIHIAPYAPVNVFSAIIAILNNERVSSILANTYPGRTEGVSYLEEIYQYLTSQGFYIGSNVSGGRFDLRTAITTLGGPEDMLMKANQISNSWTTLSTDDFHLTVISASAMPFYNQYAAVIHQSLEAAVDDSLEAFESDSGDESTSTVDTLVDD
tara:strand:+ start:6611 stop:7858 length:1248 start_codon:yes stop_codon:yes gene_type:complete